MVNEKPELALKWQFVTGGGVIGPKSIIGLLGLCPTQKRVIVQIRNLK